MKTALRNSLVLILAAAGIGLTSDPASASDSAPNVLLECEQFEKLGGWVVDQEFMDQMGSPYLLAHGLGEPVADAETTAKFSTAGKFRVWARTRDWVAPWKAPGAPGKFQLLVNGKPLATTFGTEGADWHWQDGGTVDVKPETRVALHDLTGFEGRCDAVLFCSDLNFQPTNEAATLASFRRKTLGQSEHPEPGGNFDLVVVGGGIAGSSAAIVAARLGLTVALVQDRPVLGGNSSSEVRVWPQGAIQQKPYPHVGDIVAALVSPKGKGTGNAKTAPVYGDDRKLNLVKAESRITLLLEQRVNSAEARDGVIQSIVTQHIRTAKRIRLTGRWIADCTGDGSVGFLVGADNEVSREQHQGASNLWNVTDLPTAKEVLACECKDKERLSTVVQKTAIPAPFPRCPWAVDLTNKPFPGRGNFKAQWAGAGLFSLGDWFWESGFSRDPITDMEWTRDNNFRAMYGAWDALKNVDKLYPNHRLGWAAFIAGKRESRRLMGDVVLSVEDFLSSRSYEDAAFPCSWHIDVHTPDPRFKTGHEGQEFISGATAGKGYTYKTPYWVPYRCLYSRNIKNLFMAGRDISVTHEALGPVRVMKTCGMMGEVVGMAAAVCKAHDCNPRAVYAKYLMELKGQMQTGAWNVAQSTR